jgi:hypothetical protein
MPFEFFMLNPVFTKLYGIHLCNGKIRTENEEKGN